jgi:hypothetical protein
MFFIKQNKIKKKLIYKKLFIKNFVKLQNLI